MKKMFATLALATALAANTMAQTEGTVLKVDLQTAVTDAVQYNKQLQASTLDRETYYQKVREARSAGLPQVSASLTGTTYFNKSLEFTEGMAIEMPNALTLAATASWTFSMQQIAGVKVAKIAQSLTDQTVKQTELDVKANVTDTYYAVLVYERNMEILADNLKDMQEIAEHTRHTYEVGAAEQTDVDQININVLTIQNSMYSLKRSLESTKRLLVLQMGIDINTQIETAEKLDDLLTPQALSVSSDSLNIEENLEYKQLLLSKEVNEQTVKVRKYAYIPTLTAAYQYSNALKGGFMNFDHVGSLTLTVPIFSGFQRHSQLKQAQIDVRKTETNIALMEDNLQQNAEQYAFELQTAVDAYNLQKENLEVARRVLQNYRNKYDQGALSSLDLTQANTNYLSAESSYATASLDVLTAITKLRKLYNDL